MTELRAREPLTLPEIAAMKAAGHEVKEGAKEVGHDIAETAKDAKDAATDAAKKKE